jgi:two-component system NtrC family sensor kinase
LAVLGDAGERIARIVRTLRNFVRLDEAKHQVASIEEGLESTIALMRTQIGEKISVKPTFAGVDRIPCSPGELNQVFMNLIRNASEAIEGEGVIEVATLQDDDHVTVRVQDDGRGISEERMATLFDPNFSRRGDRVRMSTGLSTALRIVQDHRGELNIDSEEERGTTVTVVLPKGEAHV